MASQIFNSTSNLLNLHSLKPQNPSNYLVPHMSTNFTKLRQDTNSYFTNMCKFSRNGLIHEAITALSLMNNNGPRVRPEFCVELLQWCVSERDLSLGEQIHGLVIKKGDLYIGNEYIETKLVIFYAKCDHIENANKMFNRLVTKNVYSWAAMIGLNSRLGLNEQALLAYCKMLESGIFPDNYVIPNVFKACGANKSVLFGKGVHGNVIKLGLEGCVYVASSLLDMYGKCGIILDAKRVFDRMDDTNVVVRNSMITSCVQNGMNDEAIQVFYDMIVDGVEPSNVSISSFLSASANLGAFHEGKQGHALVVLYGLELGTILGSCIIKFYSKLGLIKDAELIFPKMTEKDDVTWNLMISCYVQQGLVENAINACRIMRLEGFRFDSVTMASLFSACTDNNDVKLGKEVHCYCTRNRIHLDAVILASIINMYAQGGKLDYARRVFDSSLEKDIVVWNTLLASYAELGQSQEALNLFHEMQSNGFNPNVVSWNSLIFALLRNQLVDEAKQMFSEMKMRGVEPNVVTWTTLLSGLSVTGFDYEAIMFFQEMQVAGIQPNAVSLTSLLSVCINMTSLRVGKAIHGYTLRKDGYLETETSLVDMYAKCGSIIHAMKVFKLSSQKKLELYNVMISACALHGQAREALTLYKNMTEEKIEADDLTFTSILSGCSHERLINEGVEVFTDIMSKYKRKPTLEHYSCLVNLLSRCDNLDKAMKLIINMPVKPDEKMLGSILSACRGQDQVALGEYIWKYLFEVEPDNAGNYVTLSNMYAAEGKWDKVSHWRKFMKRRGLRKEPGRSWVQIGSECHVFVASDRSHPRKDDIVTILGLLKEEMSEKYKGLSLETLSC